MDDHLDALARQLESADVSTVEISQQSGAGIHLRFGDDEVEFEDSHKLTNWLQRVGASHAAFVRPYVKFPRSNLERFLDQLPRIQLSYHPFLAGNDYLFGSDSGEFAFQGFLQASAICAQNSWTRRKFLDLGIASDRVLHVGDPLVWEISQRTPITAPPKYDILWSPHWSVNDFTRFSRGYRNLAEDAKAIANLADRNLRILIRAHPSSFLLGRSQNSDSLRHSPSDQSVAHQLLDLKERPNVAISFSNITGNADPVWWLTVWFS